MEIAESKPEAIKIVEEVMNTYKSSICYKVKEALDAKQREMQQISRQNNHDHDMQV